MHDYEQTSAVLIWRMCTSSHPGGIWFKWAELYRSTMHSPGTKTALASVTGENPLHRQTQHTVDSHTHTPKHTQTLIYSYKAINKVVYPACEVRVTSEELANQKSSHSQHNRSQCGLNSGSLFIAFTQNVFNDHIFEKCINCFLTQTQPPLSRFTLLNYIKTEYLRPIEESFSSCYSIAFRELYGSFIFCP